MKRIMSNLISKNSSLIKQFSSLNAIRNDPYLSKYEQKLLQKQRELGFETVEEMVKAKRVKPVENLSELKTANSSEKKASSSNNLPPHIKPLSEILNLEKISKESAETISTIWNTFHASRENVISAALSFEFYEKLLTRLKSFPMFILPLPRDDGYEMILLQAQANQVYFTPLIEYQTNQENARPSLSLTFHTDLKSKDLVLMGGQVLSETLKPADAQHLVYQLQLFYVTGSKNQIGMVEKFLKNPGEFKYEELIESLAILPQ